MRLKYEICQVICVSGTSEGRGRVCPPSIWIWTNRSIKRPCIMACPSRFFNLPLALFSLAYYKYISRPSEPGVNRPLQQILEGICVQCITGNALARVQRVQAPADLWDITFCTRWFWGMCTRWFWGPELSFIERSMYFTKRPANNLQNSFYDLASRHD